MGGRRDSRTEGAQRSDGTQHTDRVQELELEAAPVAAPTARRALRTMLVGSPLAARGDAAVLVLSELVSNAVLHGRSPLTVVLSLGAERLRVEVRDASPVSPSFGVLDPTALTGRGMLLVASNADRWGVEPTASGKTVWVEFGPVPVADDVDVEALLAAWADDLADPAAEVVTVVVTNVDTRLLARAEAHVEALLRELSLLGLASSAPVSQLQAAERVVSAASAVEEMRTEVKRQLVAGVRGRLTRMDITLDITRIDAESVRDFATAVDIADRLSRAGSLLTEPTPRELSDARQTFLRRVLAQLGV